MRYIFHVGYQIASEILILKLGKVSCLYEVYQLQIFNIIVAEAKGFITSTVIFILQAQEPVVSYTKSAGPVPAIHGIGVYLLVECRTLDVEGESKMSRARVKSRGLNDNC